MPLSRRSAAALVLALPLAACGAGGPLGPDAPLAAPRIERGWIESANGERLALYSWPARGRARAVVLALHGFGDSGEFAFGDAARVRA